MDGSVSWMACLLEMFTKIRNHDECSWICKDILINRAHTVANVNGGTYDMKSIQ